MKNLILLYIFLCFTYSYGQAYDSDDLIDRNLEKCLASPSGQSTAGMINCTLAARKSWDMELNKNYKLLMTVLTANEREKLKIGQKKWISYRDSEIDFAGKLYHDQDGTIWSIFAANRITEITEQRVKDLESYYDHLLRG